MKLTLNLTKGLLASTLALAMVSTLTAQTAMDGVAKVIRIKGPARYTTGNNVWQPLKVGAVLRPGTIVQTSTEKDSYVDMVLGDEHASAPETPSTSPALFKPFIPNSWGAGGGGGGAYHASAEQNVIRIWENTALGIDKLSAMQTGSDLVTDTQLDLKAGRITGNVKKMSAASKYEIKLPNGVAGIRGTVYDVTADGRVRVLIGQVVLAWVDPKTGNVVTQVVMGGNQYDASSGQMSPLPAGDLKGIDQLTLSMRATGPVVGADGQTLYVPDKTVSSSVSPIGASAPSGFTPEVH